jgi:hypothetical protein
MHDLVIRGATVVEAEVLDPRRPHPDDAADRVIRQSWRP